jgi:L-seryl-tRNA(Ser) seleniumtransferase
MSHSREFPTYESLGVRPLINCMGTFTIISGSVMLPEVRQAMAEASRRYVHLDELMEAAGARIAALMQCEWGLVTNGCAAALCQITAACVAGADPEKMARLPDTTGMKNTVIVQASHRHVYDQAIRMVGVRMVEVRTRAELEAAIDSQTAMLAVLGGAAERGEISVAEMAEIGHAHGVPTLVDAAAERPDVPNRYLADGADAVGYSGGKCLRGPQASGLVLGRKELLQAAFLNGAPHHALGRPMKAGKEEIMGLLAAVEQWVRRDHAAEWQEWERRLQVITDAVTRFPTVTTAIRQPGRSNVAPGLRVTWDAETLGITGLEVKRQLSAGQPRIEVFASSEGFGINPYMMEDGEDAIVARRCAEILGAGNPASRKGNGTADEHR